MLKNVADDVRERMRKLFADRTIETERLEKMCDAAETERLECSALVEAAKDKMDLCAFQEARQKEQAARDRIEMYSARITKLNNARLVTEAESDSVIDSLLGYEADLAAEYERDSARIIDQLRALTDNYLAKVQDTESTMKQWTQNVYPNYRSETTFKNGSNRMDHPVPVRNTRYEGCAAAAAARNFLAVIGNR